jgi:hypothetical protein
MRLNMSKLDSNQNVFFARQLEDIDEKNYETLFAGMLGRRYVPLVEGIPEWANVHTYRMFEMTGSAKIIGPNANDLPRVGVKATETSRNIKQIGTSYGWSVREIQQAAATGTPLDALTVQAARSAVGREVDSLVAVGNSSHAIEGLLKLTGVNLVVPSTKTGTGAGTAWIRTVAVSPDEILHDINNLVSQTRARLKQAGDQIPMFARFTILLSSAEYGYIATTPRSANSDTTILKYALQNNPWIESIEEWSMCDTADHDNTNNRAVCYPRDPMCLGAIIPQEFTSLAPQEEGLNIVVPATGSCGGVICRYPVAVSYMDINSPV